MKRPWFIWLSIFSFVFLFMWCVFTIVRKHVKGLWMDLAAKIVLLWFGLIMLPCVLMLFAFCMLTQFLPAAALVWNCLIFVYLYLIGVYITARLYDWYQIELNKSLS